MDFRWIVPVDYVTNLVDFRDSFILNKTSSKCHFLSFFFLFLQRHHYWLGNLLLNHLELVLILHWWFKFWSFYSGHLSRLSTYFTIIALNIYSAAFYLAKAHLKKASYWIYLIEVDERDIKDLICIFYRIARTGHKMTNVLKSGIRFEWS